MSNEDKNICGVVMPISSIDGCNESHWSDVLDIISEAIEEAGFEANLVSNADDAGIIHKRIIQNLYDNPVVVCDVSGKNPNVMFELGMRLAFDKPTIIIKDDRTSYSFDTSSIEHLEYPRDLRFSKINEFKEKLSQKIKATYSKSTTDENYTTFLKHFGEFTVAKIEKKEVSGQEFIIDELKNIRLAMRRLERSNFRDTSENDVIMSNSRSTFNICLKSKPQSAINKAMRVAESHPAIESIFIEELGAGHQHLLVNMSSGFEDHASETRRELMSILRPRTKSSTESVN
ncbi:hypothetical protein J4G62_11925 [Aeromonas caviae]|uniref:hypothetical protein n=1 Tax=Aeromonas caviae TaxID=648 RepID=UPI001BD4712D|nr:hypothetical protein [Aeromonas caviae]MBS4720962.1 hypothetical protein [Aeromonas caviae]